MVVGVLGTLPFVCASGYVLTFSELSRKMSEKWASHEVLGQRPTLEWTGTDAAEVSLRIRFDASLGVTPAAGMLLLRAMTESHAAHALVIGASYFGTWVITSVSEERRHHTGAGVCLVDEVTLSIKEVTRGWA